MTKRFLLFACALSLCGAALAQQYKWVDKDGKVRYGDTPPPGVKATPLRPPPASAPAPAAKPGAKAPLTPEQAFQKRQQEGREQQDKAAKERAEADTKRSNCDSAQAALRQLQSGERIARTNQAGERVFIEDDQRAKETERAQRAVSEWCR